jgi:tRNA pseudouridine32 synthase/23S rRNA pseudouridine746 synthase
VSVTCLYEDAALLAIDKPAGALVVRGREGEREPSLLDELSAQRREKLLPVHRLDRGTSGVLLLARTADAHRNLCQSFERGEIEKRYLALVRGAPPERFTVDVALAPARRGKSRPARPGEEGKSSLTRFERMEQWPGFALLSAEPATGRPHQIRVHLKYRGFPLAFDPLYGSAEPLTPLSLGLGQGVEAMLARTPLHAQRLRLAHPSSGQALEIEAPMPEDLARVLAALRKASAEKAR